MTDLAQQIDGARIRCGRLVDGYRRCRNILAYAIDHGWEWHSLEFAPINQPPLVIVDGVWPVRIPSVVGTLTPPPRGPMDPVDTIYRAQVECSCGAHWVIKLTEVLPAIERKVSEGEKPRHVRANFGDLERPDGHKGWFIDLVIDVDF